MESEGCGFALWVGERLLRGWSEELMRSDRTDWQESRATAGIFPWSVRLNAMLEGLQIIRGRKSRLGVGQVQGFKGRTYTKASDENLYVISGVRLGDD